MGWSIKLQVLAAGDADAELIVAVGVAVSALVVVVPAGAGVVDAYSDDAVVDGQCY